jgi:hypothetical protein
MGTRVASTGLETPTERRALQRKWSKEWRFSMRDTRLARIALVGVVITSLVGCVAHGRSHSTVAGTIDGPKVGMRSAEELRAAAERDGVEGAGQVELVAALRALEELQRIEGERVELLVWRMRVVALLVDAQTEERDLLRWCRRGEELAERVRALAPERVEGHYYGAVFLGQRAQRQPSRAALWVSELETLGRRAVELDETYDDAGPLRFLGMFLVSAPSWPIGPGDDDEGLELLQRASAASAYPLNQLLLARALIETDDPGAACEALVGAQGAPTDGRWAITGPRWRPEIDRLADAASCELHGEPGLASVR